MINFSTANINIVFGLTKFIVKKNIRVINLRTYLPFVLLLFPTDNQRKHLFRSYSLFLQAGEIRKSKRLPCISLSVSERQG